MDAGNHQLVVHWQTLQHIIPFSRAPKIELNKIQRKNQVFGYVPRPRVPVFASPSSPVPSSLCPMSQRPQVPRCRVPHPGVPESSRLKSPVSIPLLVTAYGAKLSFAGSLRRNVNQILVVSGVLHTCSRTDCLTIYIIIANCRKFSLIWCVQYDIGHFRNVRGLGKSMVVFRLFEKLKYSNERSTIF